jgi:integrase
LKAYRGWVRHLQGYTRSKDPKSLSSSDVKEFLTSLAVNVDAGVLTVHDGKGNKDRTVPLPESIILELKAHLQSVATLHEKDMEAKYAGTFLFGLLEQKYRNAARGSWSGNGFSQPRP